MISFLSAANFFARHDEFATILFDVVVLRQMHSAEPQAAFSFDLYLRTLRKLEHQSQAFDRLIIVIPLYRAGVPHQLRFSDAERMATTLIHNTDLTTIEFACESGDYGKINIKKDDGIRMGQDELAVRIARISHSWLCPDLDPHDSQQVTMMMQKIRLNGQRVEEEAIHCAVL